VSVERNSEHRTPAVSLASLARDLATARVSSRQLVTDCLRNISDPDGEGARTFLKVHGEHALATADFYDRMRQQGARLPPFAGIPLSIKDLFDVAGDVTLAGSTVLRGAAPAARDAAAVTRLRSAGFVVIGRTNMTEFAFSGLGVNPHYGTPANPWDRTTRRIPGGSSSGAAVSVAGAMAFGALGTDTGGSCRIPAALCGIVGFKPTARRVPLTGAYPLSRSLDSVGPIANSVACCASLDAVLANEEPAPDADLDATDLRLGVLTNYVTDGMDPVVAGNFDRALAALTRAGARLTDVRVPELAELPDINRKGGIAAAEAYALHKARLTTDAAHYDPRVSSRMLRGREQDAADYIELLDRRSSFIARVSQLIRKFDGVLMPTVPIVAPAMSEMTEDADYIRLNALVLRNPSIVNFLDGCAVSIPCHAPGTPPSGLSVFGLGNTDRQILAVATLIESRLRDAA
jgi:aspartyl-tRNA(Asn)/glutamyl-tRNA(Gln) amidotransferase subunit A